jgi:hypothetical protein
MSHTKESFDNYFETINQELYLGYPEKLEEYLRKEWSDKWKFHQKINKLDNYPLTILGTLENLKKENLEKLSKKNCYWYIKQKDGSFGRQIKITKNPLSFFGELVLTNKINQYIIQKEIITDDFNNRKYDYRIYLLILKRNNNIEYYYYKKYVIRFAYKENDNDNDKRDIYNSITNHHIYSLQKLDENFYKINDEFEKNHEKDIINLNLKFITILKSYQEDFEDLLENNQFRILGMDYLVEKLTNKLYILELNTKPGVFYKDVIEDFFIKYNKFHENLVMNLNDVIFNNNLNLENNWIKIN